MDWQMRYYQDSDVNEITRDLFEERLLETIKAGKHFSVKGISKDAFLLKTGEVLMSGVTDEQAGRLYANIIQQIDSSIARSDA